jgi:hypothetical protein
MPQVLGTIQQIFVGKERGRAFGLFGATIGVATAIGPTFGGHDRRRRGAGRLAVDLLDQRAAVCAGHRRRAGLLPRTRRSTPGRLQLDPVGLVLLAFTIVTLMWPFLFTTGAPTDDPAGGGARALRRLRDRVHLVGAAVRGIRSLAARAVLLFSISSFRNGTLVVTTYFTAIPAMFLLTTLFLQIGIGTEPVFAGMVSIGFAVASAITAWFGGSLVARLGRPLVVAG